MDSTYSIEEFLRDVEQWQRHYVALDSVDLDNRKIPLAEFPKNLADTFRVRFMMASNGVAAGDMAYRCKVFAMAQIFIAHNAGSMFKSGLIRLHDGEWAVVTETALIAIHEAFSANPVPLAGNVELQTVVRRAKEIAAE